MPKVTFITLDGKEHEIEAEEGTTLMEIGRDANLGIEGACGEFCLVQLVMLLLIQSGMKKQVALMLMKKICLI